jgi:pyruvate dehydrogenase E2 component (dihydrolipoamide acetyltransferase)
VSTEVIMPALGVAQETGRVVEWMRSEGQEVARGEPLLEIETDKVTVSIEAPASGVLAGVRASAGQEVPVGQVIAVILAPGEEPPTQWPAGGSTPSVEQRRPAEQPSGEGSVQTGSPSATARAGRLEGVGGRPASPLARRRAMEAGIDLSGIEGTGPGGAVTARDLDVAIAAGKAGSNGERSERGVAPGPVWLRMAARVTSAWTSVPHFYLFRDVDAGRLTAWRTALGDGVTITDLLVWLVARALRRHPEVNATWQGGRIVRWDQVNVGIAVAVEDGLVVPVVHEADEMTVGEVSRVRAELVARSRSGGLRPEEVAGGTFTVTNLGMYGVDGFAAVVNAPQAAILAVGSVSDRVVAVEGSAVVRPGMTLALSCDHRVIDGARAARFLSTLAEVVEEPLGLVT